MQTQLVQASFPVLHNDTVLRTKVEKEIDDTRAAIETAQARVEAVQQRIIGGCLAEHELSLSLNAELTDLISEIQSLRRELGVDTELADMLEEALDKQKEQMFDAELEKMSSKNKESAKKLFQRISRLCHPDKCDDPKKHEIFKMAHVAYKACDVAALEGLLQAVLNVASLPAHFRTKIEELQRTLEVLKSHLLAIKRRPEYTAESDEDIRMLTRQAKISYQAEAQELVFAVEQAQQSVTRLRYMREYKEFQEQRNV